MTREFSRVQRVADQMQRELAQLIQLEVKDPRLGMVTVNAVKVSRDFGYADIYVTVLGQEEGSEALQESLRVLNNAAGFLRGRLARQIKLRTVPALRFHYDSSVVRGQQLSSLIDRAVAQDRSRQQGDSEE